jgi:hypothetical protein
MDDPLSTDASATRFTVTPTPARPVASPMVSS